MKIVTGNAYKQKEIEKELKNSNIINEQIEFVNLDLKEVMGDNIQIIIHKAIDAKKAVGDSDIIVEDVTLNVNNEFVPDIKWKQENLNENDRVQMILTLAKTEKNKIKVYEQRIDGVIHLNQCSEHYSFGFDNIFFVNNKIPLGKFKEKQPLRKIYKDIFLNYIRPLYIFDMKNINVWEGAFQNEGNK
jgi:inosine/xanthosine triphosphate pyrophosphatase family protein